MASIYHDHELADRLVELYKNGSSIIGLSRLYKISRGELSNIIRYKGIDISCSRGNIPVSYGDGSIDQYLRLYTSGTDLVDISGMYDIDQRFLSYIIEDHGIIIRQHGSRYNDNVMVFNAIDNELSAYWLGFLYADGNIRIDWSRWTYVISLALSYKDVDHITKFRDWISPGRPIRIYDVSLNGKLYKSCRVTISSKEIANNLVLLGCTPRKSLTLKFPTDDQVPREYIPHFMRGYFDGDGSVMRTGVVSICGTLEFLTSYMDILCSVGITAVKIHKCHNYYQFTKNHRKQFPLIYKFLYNNSTIYLERKKKIFDQAMKNCPSLE